MVPGAGVAELLGKKDLARHFLWTGAGSLVGMCVFIPEIKKEESSIAYQDIQTREFIADRISIDYSNFDTQKLVRRGARFMRQNVRLPVDTYDGQELSPIESRHTYLTLLYLMENKAILLKQSSDRGLWWSINWSKMPKFYRTQDKVRGKCFSCLYWTDPYDEAEDLGKDSDDLNCAVNPLHQDTQNGCEYRCDDWRKANLSESIQNILKNSINSQEILIAIKDTCTAIMPLK